MAKEPILSFMDLDVWKVGMDLAEEVYTLSLKLPKKEDYALSSQIKRASASVPSNIAEGYGRGTTGEYINHLRIARGSCMETHTQLLLGMRVKYFTQEEIQTALDKAIRVAKMLNSLIDKLEKRQ